MTTYPSADRHLMVLLHGDHVANLTSGKAGITINYTPKYLTTAKRVPLSLSLPISEGTSSHGVQRWIDGLLPTNLKVRDRWAADYNSKSSTPFDLLSTRVGHDCAGAVQFCDPDDVAELQERASGVNWKSSAQFESLIDQVATDTTSWGSSSDHPEGFSLAGAYPKVCLARREDGAWGRPVGNAPSSHILKPSPDSHARQAVNEFLAMRAAHHAGVPVARVDLMFVADRPVLAVERYDRAQKEDGSLARIHQEDAHQATGSRGHIYQTRGGVSPADIAGLFQQHSAKPLAEIEDLLRQFAYRAMISDTDGHAKNHAVMLTARDVRCAPLYDCWSAMAMNPGAGTGLRMALWSTGTGLISETAEDGYWEAAGAALGLRPKRSRRAIGNLSERFPDAVEAAVSDLPDHELVEQTAERFMAMAAQHHRKAAKTRPNRERSSSSGGDQSKRPAAAEPAPRCEKWMPRSQARCILAAGHPGPHRSRRGTRNRRY